ncbi:PQQ-binding-like beta-propeller repeat protein [bacterium]|nr:PQQ-binding-like beta-propeller repeat protein [bacterium]
MRTSSWRCALVAAVAGLAAGLAHGGDWPQFRYDARRGAASPEELPAELHLQWVRELTTPRPAFPGEIRLRYDGSYEPVVLGKTMFVPSMVTDSVTALDTETGTRCWCFFTEGPVRFAPVAWQGKVYFVSDDGHLYCVAAEDGALLWKHRGLPAGRSDRKVLGDGRLVSLFPARGGPALSRGVIYYGAGLWSAEGVFVHALDAATGRVLWSNTESHRIEKANMDHGVGTFAGLTPQGYLAVVDGRLVVPCGQQLPALLNPATGTLHTYTMGWGGRVGLPKGSWFVAGVGKYLLHGGSLYDLQQWNQERFRKRHPGRLDFKSMLYVGGMTRLQIDRTNQRGLGAFREPVLAEGVMYCQDKGIVAYDLTAATLEERAKTPVPEHRKLDQYPDKTRAVFRELWRLPRPSKVHIRAGGRLYCGASGLVEAIDLPRDGEAPKVSWRASIQGTPSRMLAADGRLFAVTREGRIYAFAAAKRQQPAVHAKPTAPPPKADVWTQRAASTLEAAGAASGIAVVLGIGSGRLAMEIVRQSRRRVIAIEPDAAKAATLRDAFHQAGLYGTRISIHVGDPTSFPFPPYLASLVVSEDAALLAAASDRVLAEAVVHCLRPYGGTACLWLPPDRREGFYEAVSGGGFAGIATRRKSPLILVTRAGALPGAGNWSHRGANAANTGACQDEFVKPPLGLLWFSGAARWSRRPELAAVRIAGGRLIVKAQKLHAIDVFTGRRLWDTPLPPSLAAGGELVAHEDVVYVAGGKLCLIIDPRTGSPRGELKLPEDVKSPWTSVRVDGAALVGASGTHLLCMDLRSGKPVWRAQRPRPIGDVVLGGGRVFCADKVHMRRGKPLPPHAEARIQAFAADTGKLLWEAPGASTLRYSQPLDLLFAASGVYRGADGARVRDGATWPFTADKLLSGAHDGFVAHNLRTGEKSKDEPLLWNRRGCTSLRASTHMLTTRYKGNAAVVDITTRRITSLWNVRGACSNNIFPANGVLSVPNLTGGCTCNYLPVSQAFVPAATLRRVATSSAGQPANAP